MSFYPIHLLGVQITMERELNVRFFPYELMYNQTTQWEKIATSSNERSIGKYPNVRSFLNVTLF